MNLEKTSYKKYLSKLSETRAALALTNPRQYFHISKLNDNVIDKLITYFHCKL